MDKRNLNEKKFKVWEVTDSGDRIYKKKIPGKFGWYAIYEKIVDKNENTLSFTQYIYNENGDLKELHKKFPTDTGHKIL